MGNKLNKNIIITILILIIIVGYFLFSDKKDTYEGVYYPNGCLICEEDYIFSQEFELMSSCFSWALQWKANRRDDGLNVGADQAECGLNCEWDGGFMVCEETFDVPL